MDDFEKLKPQILEIIKQAYKLGLEEVVNNLLQYYSVLDNNFHVESSEMKQRKLSFFYSKFHWYLKEVKNYINNERTSTVDYVTEQDNLQ